MKKIKTFAQACKALGIDPKALPDVTALPATERKALVAYYKLGIIIQALNDGWKPNWFDTNERKWFIWPDIKATKSKPGVLAFRSAASTAITGIATLLPAFASVTGRQQIISHKILRNC